jgi:hypothetical protein
MKIEEGCFLQGFEETCIEGCDQDVFLMGYEWGLTGNGYPADESEIFVHGWSMGVVEAEGLLKATAWQARWKRFRNFLWYMRKGHARVTLLGLISVED